MLEQIGFDPRLPVFGNDIDFGWRVARAGHRIVVVPDAVVFHAEATSRGVRRTLLTGSHVSRGQRQAALYTMLVNGSGRGLPWRIVRLFFGSLLRVIGFLLVRAPREAYDELAALMSTYLRPQRIVSARSARRRTATVPHSSVKHLLAPTWLPYRHGLDFVSDVASAVVNQAADLTAARRERTVVETGPIDEETQNLAPDTGLLAKLVFSPIAWVFVALVAIAVIGTRGHLGSGMLSGGALLPPPDSVGHWWSTAFEGWHDLGVGSTTPAAPYLLPLALAGTVLLGKAWLVLDIVFFFVVPIAAWGGFRFLRRLTGSWVAAVWGGVAYGVTPVLSGSVQQGRLGTVVAAIVLPWLAHSALFLFTAETADRRWRAAFRVALWLALISAFAPLAFLLAVVAVVMGLLLLRSRSSLLFARVWAPTITSVVVALVLLLPWALSTWFFRGASSWLFEAGRPASDLIGDLTALDIVLGRPGDVASAPGWVSIGFAVAALVALARSDTRPRVATAWCFVVLGLAGTALLSGMRVELASTGTDERLWLGVPLLLVQAAGITAIATCRHRHPRAAHRAHLRLAPARRCDRCHRRRGHSRARPRLVGPQRHRRGDRPASGGRGPGVHDRRGRTRSQPRRARRTRNPGRRLPLPAAATAGAADRRRCRAALGRRAERAHRPGRSPRVGPDERDHHSAGGHRCAVRLRTSSRGPAARGQPRQHQRGGAGQRDCRGLAGLEAREFPAATRPTPDSGSRLYPWLVALQCLAVVVAAVFAAPTRKRAES